MFIPATWSLVVARSRDVTFRDFSAPVSSTY